MKKIVALLLAAVMAFALVACGNSNNDQPNSGGQGNQSNPGGNGSGGPEAVSLKVWVPEEEMEITQQMCEAFNAAHPEFDCTFEIAVVGVDESSSKLENDPDTAADVFQVPTGSLSQLKDAGLIYPITANIDEVKALYGEGSIEACTRSDANGEFMYGIPFTPNSWFLFYNKSLFTEDDVKSLDTMMAKDLGTNANGESIYNFSCNIDDSWYIEAFFYAAGCTLYGPDGEDPTDCTWNNAGGVAAGNYLVDLINNPKYLEEADGIAGSMMKDGRLGAISTGVWSYPDLYEALGDDLGACPLPTIKLNGSECQLSNFADYKCFSVKSGTSAPMAAQLLAEWLGNADNQLTRYKEAGATPTILSLQDDPDVASNVGTAAMIAQSAVATAQPAISQINEYWSPVKAFGEGIVNKEITKANMQANLDKVVDAVTSTLTG